MRRSGSPRAFLLLLPLAFVTSATGLSAAQQADRPGERRLAEVESDSLTARIGLFGNPVAGLVHHPTWPGVPRFLLPDPGVGIELWGLDLSDRWGPDRSRSPRLRTLPLLQAMGFRAGGFPAPGALIAGGTHAPASWDPARSGGGEGTLRLGAWEPPDGWEWRAAGGYHALSLTGAFREGGDHRQWAEFQSGHLGVAVAGSVWPRELTVVAALEHSRFHRENWGNAYERGGESRIGFPVEEVTLFRDQLREGIGRWDDGDFHEADLVTHATSAGIRVEWSPDPAFAVTLSALGVAAREVDDLRLNPFALDGSFPTLEARAGTARLHLEWDPVRRLALRGGLTVRAVRESGGSSAGSPEVLAIRSTPIPGSASGRGLLAGVPWSAQGDSLRETDLRVDAASLFRLGRVEMEVGAEMGGAEVERIRRPGTLGRYIYDGAVGLETDRPQWSERIVYPSGAGRARAHILQRALWLSAGLDLPGGLQLTGGVRGESVRYPSVPARNLEPAGRLNTAFASRPDSDPVLLPRAGLLWRSPTIEGLELHLGGGLFRDPVPYTLLLSAYRNRGGVRVECRLPDPSPLSGPPALGCPGAAQRTETAAEGDAVLLRPGFRDPIWIRGGLGGRLDRGGWGLRAGWQEGWTGSETVVRELNAGGSGSFTTPLAPIDPELGSVAGLGSWEGARLRRFQLGGWAGWKGFLVEADGVRSRRSDHSPLHTADPFRRIATTVVDGSEPPELGPSRLDDGDRISAGVSRTLGESIRLGLRLHHHEGIPFTWVVDGDLNGDGLEGNDLLRLPPAGTAPRFRRPEDTARYLDRVEGDECLRRMQEGASSRNRCRGRSIRQLDLEGRLRLPFTGWMLTLEVENVTNAISRGWGRVEIPPPTVPLLRLVGRQGGTGEPIFDLLSVPRQDWTLRPQSMWRARFGLEVLLP